MISFLMFFVLFPFYIDELPKWKVFCHFIISTLIQINFYLYFYNLYH